MDEIQLVVCSVPHTNWLLQVQEVDGVTETVVCSTQGELSVLGQLPKLIFQLRREPVGLKRHIQVK